MGARARTSGRWRLRIPGSKEPLEARAQPPYGLLCFLLRSKRLRRRVTLDCWRTIMPRWDDAPEVTPPECRRTFPEKGWVNAEAMRRLLLPTPLASCGKLYVSLASLPSVRICLHAQPDLTL